MNVRAPIQTAFLLFFCATLTLTHERAEAQTRRGIFAFFAEIHDGDVHYKWMDGDDLLDVRIEGDVWFTDDDGAVERLSRGGHLKIEQKKGGTKRTLEVRPASDGTVRYTYKVDGRKYDYDATTRDEVADLILAVIRETGMGADRRVARILEREGVEGVFEEIDHIESSFAKRRYFTALLEQGKLNTAQLQQLAREVSRQIGSSGDRARFLREAAPYYLDNSQAYAAYFDAINTIASSGDHTRTLIHILEQHDPDREAFFRLLRSAQGIDSSGDKARTLIKATAHYDNDPEIRKAFFEAVDTIASSGDHTRTLKALLENADLDQASVTALFQSVQGIKSSGDKARLLVAAAPHFMNDAAQRATFFEAVNTIPSSGDHARVLLALLRENQLDQASLLAVLESAKGISSSGDKTRVLVGVAPLVASDDDLVAAYLNAAETISSSGDHTRALSALVRQN